MPTEDAFAATPDATGGRALLEARLERLSPSDLAAFREAVRRCYGGPPDEEQERQETRLTGLAAAAPDRS